MKAMFPIFGLVFLSFSAKASAGMSLSEAIRESWQRSPHVQGQETQASLASGDRWRRFIFNEPQLLVMNSDDSTALSYGLSLTTSFPGKNLAFTQVDSARESQQKAELVGKKQDLAKLIAQSYLDCAGNEALTRIQQVNIDDLATVQRSLRFLYESGHSTQSDTIQADLQLRQAQSDMIALEDKTQVSCQKLNDVLRDSGVTEAPDLALSDDIDPGLVSELGQASGDVRRSEAALQVAQANLDTAWWTQLPDLTFAIQRNHYLYLPGSPSGKEWTNNYSVSVTLPILFPFRETVEARRLRSQANIDEGTASLQLAQAHADEQDAAREYQRSRARLAELRHKDLALAEALRDSILSSYRAGKVGFADLMLARKTYSDLRVQEIQLQTSIIGAHLRCLNQCTATR